jgi:putative SbcD/Mre11-related phosphoesterase
MQFVFDDRAVVLKSKQEDALVVSDLHLGYEVELEQRGVHIPSQHVDMISRIKDLIETYNVKRLYIIGDIKHSIMIDSSYNWEIVPEFMDTISMNTKTIIIPGNHDGDLEAVLPRRVLLSNVTGTIFKNDEYKIGLIHGHAWPSKDVLASNMIIMGHNHPAITRKKRVSATDLGRTERIRSQATIPVVLRSTLDRHCVCEKMGIEKQEIGRECKLLILPSFNSLISGIPVNRDTSELQGPFYVNGCIDFPNSDVLSTQGLFLGKVKQLRVENQRKH